MESEIATLPNNVAPRPCSRQVSIVSKRKSLWKMVRSLLLPQRMMSAVFGSCGGVQSRKIKRRLDKYRRGGIMPSSPAVISSIPLPTSNETNEEDVGNHLQNLTLTPSPIEEIVNSDVNEIVVRRRPKKDDQEDKFHGWRKSSIDVTSEAPQTLKWIPSGLVCGDRVIWLSGEDGESENGTVRWIGKIREQFHAGVEFDRPIGNSSGLYGYGSGLFARLFTSDLRYGRFLPVEELVLYSDFYDKGLKAGFICIICRDDFLQLPDSQGDQGHMVATKCGHLYHKTCLDTWLASKSRGKKSGDNSQPCPHCQSPINYEERDNIIRLFPAQM